MVFSWLRLKNINFLIPILISISLAGCGKSDFEVTSLKDSASPQDTSSGPTTDPANQLFQNLELEGYVSGGAYDNSFSFNLDKKNNTLVMNLPIPSGPFNQVFVDIPDLKGARIKTYFDSNNHPQVAVSIPLQHILNGVKTLPVSKLPNGNPLPALPSGEAPSLAFGLNQNSENKVYMYLGVNAIGLYIENSFIPSYLGMTFPVKNKAKTKILGYFTIIPQVGSFSGGLFVSLPLSNEAARIIDNHMRRVPPLDP